MGKGGGSNAMDRKYQYLKFDKVRDAVTGKWRIENIEETEYYFTCEPEKILASLKKLCRYSSQQKTFYLEIGAGLIAVCTRVASTPIFLVKLIEE